MLHVMIIMQEVSTCRCLQCVITDWRFVAPVVIVDPVVRDSVVRDEEMQS